MSTLGNKEIMAKNIRYYMDSRGIDRNKICADLNLKYTTFTDWINAKTYPRIDKIELMANYFGISKSDLVEDKSTHPQEDDINFNKSFNIFNYAHYPVGISAGQLQEVDSLYNVPKIPIPDVMMGRYARNKNICIMHVNGESMNNVINDGAIIAVQRNIELSQLKNGDIVVADNGKGEYTVKRFYLQEDGVVLLRPDSSNVSFTDIKIDIKNGEQVNIFGKVVIYNVIL